MPGAVFAGRHLARPKLARERGSTRDDETRFEYALLWIGVELDDRHRRGGPEVVRAEEREKLLSEPRKFGVDLELHTGSEKREALEQTLGDRADPPLNATHAFLADHGRAIGTTVEVVFAIYLAVKGLGELP